MQHLILRPGPELALREFRPQPDDLERRPQEHDVTERAHEFLFEPVTLHVDTTLAEDLRQRVAEVRGGTVETVSSDDLFERLDVPRCAAMFDDLGGHRPREIGQALRNIGDAENAARWIEQKFEGRLLVKADYRGLSGREFRRAYQSVRV